MANYFFYGTLMTGFKNYRQYIQKRVQHSLIPATVNGTLYHLQEGYPALLDGEQLIAGEMLVCDDEDLLTVLDTLEGYIAPNHPDNLYIRKEKWINVGKRIELAWVYFFNAERYPDRIDEAEWIKSGNWRDYLLDKHLLIQ